MSPTLVTSFQPDSPARAGQEASMSAVHDVSAATFQTDVIERSASLPVVVDFWAPWCGPCRRLGPVLEKLAAEANGRWVLTKLNTDENQALAQRYQIQGIPAVKAFRDGKVVAEFVGALPEDQVVKWLSGIVPDEAEVAVRRARALLAEGKKAEAAVAYAEALRHDAGRPEALLHEAGRLADAGDGEGARARIARLRPRDRDAFASQVGALELKLDAPPLAEARAAVDQSPEDPAARYQLGLALAATGDHAEALEVFLGLVKRNRAYGDDAGRKAMLRVFDAVGPRSAIADEYRRRLAMELYR
jgi:putative thioredoxin